MLYLMPWRGHAARFCHGCGKHVSECGQLSARYKCEVCGNGNASANRRQLIDHSGPFFENWRRQSLAALGVFVPLDDSNGRT